MCVYGVITGYSVVTMVIADCFEDLLENTLSLSVIELILCVCVKQAKCLSVRVFMKCYEEI